MAKRIKNLKKRLDTPPGRVVSTVASAVFYAALLFLVCMYFSGNGAFIYEGF